MNSVEPVVFVSASIPDPARWRGEFDAFAITDAVVATAKSVFTRGGVILTAAHPTVAPLILQVADGFPGNTDRKMVILYQSELFRPIIPDATKEMMSRRFVEVVWTPAVDGETPEPGRSEQSLLLMRQRMFEDVVPVAAVFIGGMDGIREEFALFGQVRAGVPRIPLGRPGGVAATLKGDGDFGAEVAESDLYPWVMDRAMNQVLGQPRFP